MNIIRLENITKKFGEGTKQTAVLQDISLSIEENEMLAIRGKSGSGKTTLLNILAGIDFPSSGSYYFRGKEISLHNQNDAAKFRRKHVAVVVQHFALLDDLTAYENISMALWSEGISNKEERKRVESIMEELDILPLKKKYPTTLSGGEKQRVAIARAIIRNPDLILADEPTGALDEATGQQIVSVFQRLHDNGHTIFIVTHDEAVANQCSRTVYLRDGVIVG